MLLVATGSVLGSCRVNASITLPEQLTREVKCFYGSFADLNLSPCWRSWNSLAHQSSQLVSSGVSVTLSVTKTVSTKERYLVLNSGLHIHWKAGSTASRPESHTAALNQFLTSYGSSECLS